MAWGVHWASGRRETRSTAEPRCQAPNTPSSDQSTTRCNRSLAFRWHYSWGLDQRDHINRERILVTGHDRKPGGPQMDPSDSEVLRQVHEMLARMTERSSAVSAFNFDSPVDVAARATSPDVRRTQPALPPARFIRSLIRERELRTKFLPSELFAEPAWDILLDLSAAHMENRSVSITSLCIASKVPPTTALRWIGQMAEVGILVRTNDPLDGRRAFIELSDLALQGMARYFEELIPRHGYREP